MARTRSQNVLLTLTTAFASLQFLPHFLTSLVDHWLQFCYGGLSLALFFVTIVFAALILLLWDVSNDAEFRRRSRDWFLTLSMMTGITVAMLIANFAYHRGLPTGSFSRRFDQTVWARDESSRYVEGDITDRQKMLGDVIRKVVVGGTKQSIAASLGPPDSGVLSSSGHELLYLTGPQRGSFFAIDNEWLLIWFDDQGRTLRYEIRSD